MYVLRVGHEKCRPDKDRIATVYPRYAIHYITAGQGFLGERKLKDGMGFLCHAGEWVEYRPDPSDPWEYYWIALEGEGCAEFFQTIENDRNVFAHQLHNKLSAFFQFASQVPEYREVWQHVFPQIIRAFHSTASAPSNAERYVMLAKQLMEDDANIRVEQIAETLHINRCYLRHIFVQHEGVSPQQYRQRRRMEYARDLLLHTRHPIHIIASSAGYTDCLQFSRAFRKYFALSPTQYRTLRASAAETPLSGSC